MQHLLLECALRAVLIAAGTAAVLEILRVKTAGAQHCAWAGVVLLMLVLPVWTAWGPKAVVPVLPALTAQGATRRIAAVDASSAHRPAEGLNLERSQPPSPAWNWRTCLACLYLFGVAALLLRLMLGTIRAHLLVRRSFRREGRLTSSWCAAPVTVGWLRPTVILPECWREWPESELDAVLTHEGEHARRRDPLVQWLALLNRAIFWFHPLAWWLERRLSALAEEACDAAVLARGHDRYQYSAYLLDIAQSVVRSGARVNVCGMAMPGSFLTTRIRRILEGHPAPRLTRARTLCAAAACTILSLVFAAGAVDYRKPQPAGTIEPTTTIEAAADALVATPLSPKPLDEPMTAAPAKVVRAYAARAAAFLAQAQTTPPAPTPSQPSKDLRFKDHRLLVMYFDIQEMTDADLSRSVGAAQNFVRTRLQPQDLLAIMTYRDSAVRILEDFTLDRDMLLQTLQQLIAVRSPDSGEVSHSHSKPAVLRTAIQMLEPLSGKKALIFYSTGPSTGRDSQTEVQETIDAAVRANVAIYSIDARGLIGPPR